jgi:hypothetical protein
MHKNDPPPILQDHLAEGISDLGKCPRLARGGRFSLPWPTGANRVTDPDCEEGAAYAVRFTDSIKL